MERKRSKEYSVAFLGEDEKFKLRNLPSRASSLFSSRRRACPVLKHNRVSEVFKKFKVHDFENYGNKIRFEMQILIYAITNVSFTSYLC